MASLGLVNAVLRRGADNPWVGPDDATRLSYPDWVVDALTTDLGHADALAALEVMNTTPPVTERADGYTQDLASQWRSEEHTSELQSLMRISYAVFCLKKKKKKPRYKTHNHTQATQRQPDTTY